MPFNLVVVAALPPDVHTIFNEAVAFVFDGDANPDDNRDDEETPVAPAAPDLVIQKTDQGFPVAIGQTLLYGLVYQNVGTLDATGVVIVETVPFDTQAASNPDWEVGTVGSGIACVNSPEGTACVRDIGNVPAGGLAAVESFRVLVNGPGPDPIVNTVRIESFEPDANPSDNVSRTITPLTGPPDLTLFIDVSVLPDGKTVKGFFSVTNIGLGTAENVTVETSIPTGTTAAFDNDDFFFTGTNTPCVNAPAGTFCEARHPSLAPGDTVDFLLKLSTDPPIDAFTVAGEASDDGVNGVDPTPANNLSSGSGRRPGGAGRQSGRGPRTGRRNDDPGRRLTQRSNSEGSHSVRRADVGPRFRQR